MTDRLAPTDVVDPAGRAGRARTVTREERLLLVGIPVLVALVLGGYVVWRQTATLDAIERRQLAWGTVLQLTWEHVLISVVATVLVVGIAIPLGVALTRPGLRRSRRSPSASPTPARPPRRSASSCCSRSGSRSGSGRGVLAFTLYGILPVLRNTITGLEGVDPTLVEAGRGMGMSTVSVLRRVELPLALPVIMAGVRTALVLVVGVAAFATFINAGGLGSLIVTGITLFRYSVLVSGALLIAVLALVVEWAGRLLEVAARPKGL